MNKRIIQILRVLLSIFLIFIFYALIKGQQIKDRNLREVQKIHGIR